MHNLSIIVPFRNREEHLLKFVPHMKMFLNQFEINYHLYVIEQIDNKPFNRAKLLNVGFNETKHNNDYFCFHDVDMLPVNFDCDYSYIDGACRVSHFVSQFGFIPRPESEFGGGVIMINKQSFEKVNGFSNNYWGWGVEDNDFSERCKRKNIIPSFRKGRFLSLTHEPNGDTLGKPPSIETIKNREYFNSIIKSECFFDSGLSSLDYKLEEKIESSNYTKLVVSL